MADSGAILFTADGSEHISQHEEIAESQELDMSEAATSLKEFERRVMWRKRLLALQDRVALAVLVGCAVAAAFVLLARLKEGGRVPWAILAPIFAIEAGVLFFNWVMTRANEREAAFAIDDTLELE